MAMHDWRMVQGKFRGIDSVVASGPAFGAGPQRGMHERLQRHSGNNTCPTTYAHSKRRARQHLGLIFALLSAAHHLFIDQALCAVAVGPHGDSTLRTVVTSRRSALLSPLPPSLGAAVLAPASTRADMRTGIELPPLPKAYHDTVVDLATATKDALLTSIRGTRSPGQQMQEQLRQQEAKVGKLLERYEETFVVPSAASKLDATVLEHPVYFAVQRAIGELKSGGRQADDMQTFRLDLIREMTAILRLTEKAGVSPGKQ